MVCVGGGEDWGRLGEFLACGAVVEGGMAWVVCEVGMVSWSIYGGV